MALFTVNTVWKRLAYIVYALIVIQNSKIERNSHPLWPFAFKISIKESALS